MPTLQRELCPPANASVVVGVIHGPKCAPAVNTALVDLVEPPLGSRRHGTSTLGRDNFPGGGSGGCSNGRCKKGGGMVGVKWVVLSQG
jgi:hypothetical protein